MSGRILKRIAFKARLSVPVLDVRMREGEYLQGEAGWGEVSPLPNWRPEDQVRSLQAATEAATQPFPEQVRKRVRVNCMVPRVSPAQGVAIASSSGCKTVKVKVGDASGIERVAAIREAMGDSVLIRLDVNGAWVDVDHSVQQIRRFEPFGIELIEDPLPVIEDLAELRRRQPVPIAAESCVRDLDDVRRVVELDAADALVLKPQRFGGVRACLEAAEIFSGPVIASSALETSVGLAAVLALALALPDAPFAHGIGTALLFEEDPSESLLAPIGGMLVGRRIGPSPELLSRGSR